MIPKLMTRLIAEIITEIITKRKTIGAMITATTKAMITKHKIKNDSKNKTGRFEEWKVVIEVRVEIKIKMMTEMTTTSKLTIMQNPADYLNDTNDDNENAKQNNLADTKKGNNVYFKLQE